MIIAIASEKGGTGKTTITTNLAIVKGQEAAEVLLVDADPQQSSTDFSSVRSEKCYSPYLSCSSMFGENAGEDLRKLRYKYDDIFVDVGGVTHKPCEAFYWKLRFSSFLF